MNENPGQLAGEVTSAESRVAIGAGVNRVGAVESRGVEIIPEVERNRSPQDLFWVYFGTNQVYSMYILGGLLPLFGLNWWWSVLCAVIGTAIGTTVFVRMVLFGPRTGTNATVASGVFFGIRGRYIGSTLSQIISLGFNALAIWAGGQALEFSFHRWFGTPTGTGALTVAMVVATAAMIAVCLYGNATIVSALRFVVLTNLAAMVILCVLSAGHFHVDPVATPYTLGSLFPTFLLGLTVAIVGPISYGTTGSDYSRYIPSNASDRAVLGWTWLGMFLGVVTALLVGAFITLCFSNVAAPFIGGMVGISPVGYLVPLIAIGFIGNTAGTAVNFYNMTLDLQAVIWRLERVQVGVIVSIVTLIVTYLGVVAFNALNFINAFVTTVTVLIMPWIMINLVGYWEHHGEFKLADMHAYASDDHGAYWYTRGFNIRGIASFAIGVVVGLMFTNTTIIHGPLSGIAGGVDLSSISSMVVGAGCYWLWGRVETFSRTGSEPAVMTGSVDKDKPAVASKGV